jgi:hypothetical protein
LHPRLKGTECRMKWTFYSFFNFGRKPIVSRFLVSTPLHCSELTHRGSVLPYQRCIVYSNHSVLITIYLIILIKRNLHKTYPPLNNLKYKDKALMKTIDRNMYNKITVNIWHSCFQKYDYKKQKKGLHDYVLQ